VAGRLPHSFEERSSDRGWRRQEATENIHSVEEVERSLKQLLNIVPDTSGNGQRVARNPLLDPPEESPGEEKGSR
jgi:hypothetical protein